MSDTGDRTGLLADTLAEMTAASLERADLAERELMLVRLAALVASGAPTGSYLLNLPSQVDAGITLEDAQAVLIAVAPIIGTARTTQAVGKIARALGIALELEEQYLED